MSIPIYMVAATMANLSTLGAIEPAGVVFNIMLGRFLLKEKITKYKLVAMGLFIPGMIVTLKYASMETHRFDRLDFQNIFYKPLPISYLWVSLFVWAVGSIVWYYIWRIYLMDEEYDQFLDEGAESSSPNKNLPDSSNSRLSKQISYVSRQSRTMGLSELSNKQARKSKLVLIPCLFYPYFGAFFMCVTFAFVRIFYGFYEKDPPPGYSSNFEGFMPKFLILFAVSLMVLSFIILNKGEKHYDATIMVPILDVWELFHSLLCGAIFLDELNDYEGKTFELWMFFTGVIILFTGIGVLLWDKENLKNDETVHS